MGTSVRMVDLTYGHLVSGSEFDARRRLDEWARMCHETTPHRASDLLKTA